MGAPLGRYLGQILVCVGLGGGIPGKDCNGHIYGYD